ncbi:hypothetical protein [Nocardioides sp.]|uniref:hypothetical protein n=1 Tax=Nocardioides sp. TaxID=35761 RepID=UPI001A17FD35|nr:hypothetical protein [Nocardioides sp.]MBJ7357157.1 hypothetical protein [Nocardioides sp.]
MRLPHRRPSIELVSGESELARAESEAGLVVGTRDALYVPTNVGHVRVPWEQVESADWDSDGDRLRVREVGTWGEPRPEYLLTIADPGRLLELVRERVTATVVLQRHVAVEGRRGVRVIARRAPSGPREVTWLFEYDEGIDPADPQVVQAADRALATAQADVGL